MSRVRADFDSEAEQYDRWKQRNAYYYDAIKRLYRSRIPAGATVLEVGCGTGDILADLSPERGVGIDISPQMIRIARDKHPDLEWHAHSTSDLGRAVQQTFDVAFLSDVIEHLEDVEQTFRDLVPFCNDKTRLMINMANPLWEPLLLILEWLGLKMPEGPHKRIRSATLVSILRRCGFELVDRDYRLLVPKRIPVVSLVAERLARLPIVRRACLIYFFEFCLRPDSCAGTT